MYQSFSAAAAAISQLYSMSLTQNKSAYAQGQRDALGKVLKWLLDVTDGGAKAQVRRELLEAFLKDELEDLDGDVVGADLSLPNSAMRGAHPSVPSAGGAACGSPRGTCSPSAGKLNSHLAASHLHEQQQQPQSQRALMPFGNSHHSNHNSIQHTASNQAAINSTIKRSSNYINSALGPRMVASGTSPFKRLAASAARMEKQLPMTE